MSAADKIPAAPEPAIIRCTAEDGEVQTFVLKPDKPLRVAAGVRIVEIALLAECERQGAEAVRQFARELLELDAGPGGHGKWPSGPHSNGERLVRLIEAVRRRARNDA